MENINMPDVSNYFASLYDRKVASLFAMEAVRMNQTSPEDLTRIEAWKKVYSALTEVLPGWNFAATTVSDCAVQAIKTLAERTKTQETLPFDLEAAKRGDPIVTRDGRKARFIAHVPESMDEVSVIAFVEGRSACNVFNTKGEAGQGHADFDLFMAPKPKRTIWINVYADTGAYSWHKSEEAARRAAGGDAIAIAVPVEIDE